MKPKKDRWALYLFVASAAFLIFGYGVTVGMLRIYPFQVFVSAARGYIEFCTRYEIGAIGKALPWYYMRVPKPYPPAILNTDEAYQGVNFVAGVGPDRTLLAKIMDMDGNIIHQWDIDWFKTWPDAKHIPARLLPQSPPGTHMHGTILMENGDLIVNFEHLGLVRFDPQSEVVWRMPYQTHHSIERDDDGNLWVCGQKEHYSPTPRFPNRVPPFVEFTILKVTPEGKIIKEFSVGDILSKNDLNGVQYLGTLAQRTTQVTGDVLHLNDIEPFPDRLEEGFFEKGDLLISLRNTNTIFAFNQNTEKIKFICSGWFIRQHDPDFIDGNTFSVFDNNLAGPPGYKSQSRIVLVSAPDKTAKTLYEGTPEHPFYTYMMGKHQWLPNGNMLITESCKGRAFEINPQGEIVWEFFNYVDEGVSGLLDEVKRLPLETAKLFSSAKSSEKESHEPAVSQESSATTNTTGESP